MRKRAFVGLAMLAVVLAGCDEPVYSNLSARDANEMAALLYRHNISATRTAGENNTYSLAVPQADFAQAVDVLNQYGYPKEQYRSIAEVFPGDGLIVSPFEQHARLTYATSQELTKTINAIDGVVFARVHVVLPEIDLRSTTTPKATASVMVINRPNVDTAELSSKIRLLVANAVQNLDYKDVSLAFFPSDGASTESLSAGDNAAGANEGMDLAKFMSASPSTSFMLWVMAGLAGAFGVIMFLRRLQSRV